MENEKPFVTKPRPVLLRNSPRYVRSKLKGKVFLIPSFITVLGTFCGFLAIISAFKGNIEYACKYIGFAFILDGLDGRVARKLNATSAFGKEFDSMSDLIAFGVAPAIIAYCWAFNSLADEFGILVTFVYVVCAATRLARFNLSEGSEPKKHFEGLPSPAAAGAIVSIVYLFPTPITNIWLLTLASIFVITIASLMVTTFSYFSIKNLKLTEGNPKINLLVLSLLVAFIWYNFKIVVPILALIYAASGPTRYFRKKLISQGQKIKNVVS